MKIIKKSYLLFSFALLFVYVLGNLVLKTSAQSIDQTQRVTRGEISNGIVQSGLVVPKNSADIFSTINGTVEEVYVKQGDQINKNGPLLKVKNSATPEQKERAYEAYTSARNSTATLRRTYERMTAIMGAINRQAQSIQEIQQTYPDLPVATQSANKARQQTNQIVFSLKNDLAALKNDIAEAEKYTKIAWQTYQSTQDLIITAPIQGEIISFNTKLGDTVLTEADAHTMQKITSQNSAYSHSISQIPIITIGDAEDLNIQIVLPKDQAKTLEIGQEVNIQFDALNGGGIEGEATKIEEATINNYGEEVQKIYLDFDQNPHIKPYMKALVSVISESKDDVMSVPNSAIQYKNGQPSLKILSDAKRTEPHSIIPIKVGWRGIKQTEILEGVTEGTRFIYE